MGNHCVRRVIDEVDDGAGGVSVINDLTINCWCFSERARRERQEKKRNRKSNETKKKNTTEKKTEES